VSKADYFGKKPLLAAETSEDTNLVALSELKLLG